MGDPALSLIAALCRHGDDPQIWSGNIVFFATTVAFPQRSVQK
jgi:hypothetical protein